MGIFERFFKPKPTQSAATPAEPSVPPASTQPEPQLPAAGKPVEGRPILAEGLGAEALATKGEASAAAGSAVETEIEAEPLPTVRLMYRSNDTFVEAVPVIAQTLQSMGRRVEVQSFDQGTPVEEIQQWLKEHQGTYQHDVLLTDGTVRSAMNNAIGNDAVGKLNLPEIGPHDGWFHKPYLDDLMTLSASAVIRDLLIDESTSEYIKDDEQVEDKKLVVGRLWIKVFRYIFQQGEKPNRVVLVKDMLYEHFPFCPKGGTGLPGGLQAEFSRLREGGQMEEARRIKFNYFKPNDDEAAELIKGWLMSAGMDETSITVTDSLSAAKVADAYDTPGTWILTDRHNSPRGWSKNQRSSQSARELNSPLDSLVENARNAGMLRGSTEQWHDSIVHQLKNDIPPDERVLAAREQKITGRAI